jgi:hypothetical protein
MAASKALKLRADQKRIAAMQKSRLTPAIFALGLTQMVLDLSC